MKLWLISQTENGGYDTYDSAVVAAETASEAQQIHPSGKLFSAAVNEWWETWAEKPENVKVRLIGEAIPETKYGVIIASFNAG